MNKEELIGYKWALRVVNCEEIANKYIKLECKRYVDRLNGLDKDIEFDYDEVKVIYSLLSVINYATGFYANKAVIEHIHGFQAMILENLFCLYYKELDSLGFRKKVIEECYLEIGRKAGKSFIAGLINLLLMLRADRFAQFACAGKTREISSLVRTSVVELINSSPAIKKHFKITRDRITCKLNESTMLHLSGEADNINGKLLTAYVCDEVANMSDSGVVDALKLSQMSTKTRLSIYISTQYGNPTNVFNDLIDYHKKILDGIDDSKNTFGLLFELDVNDDFREENNWYKCNPLQMGLENGRDFLRQEFKKGLTIESAMNEFRIKILNERLNMAKGESFVDFNAWKKTEVDKIDFSGKQVILGIDLSVSIDLSSICMGYKENDNYYFKSIGFLGRDSIPERREKFDYFSAERRGECFINDGRIVDYNAIKEFIITLEENYNCKIIQIVTDPYNSLNLMSDLSDNYGYDVIMLRQTYSNLTLPTKEAQRAIYEGNLFHQKSKLFDNHIADTVLSVGKSGDVMIDKSVARKGAGCHIDLVATMIFAFKQLYDIKPKINWDERLKNGFVI